MIASTGRQPRRALSGMMAVTCVVALCTTAHAGVAPPFAALLRQTANAPRLAASEADIRRAEGLSEQAHARPNPTVSVQTENVAGSQPYRGFDRAETTLQYSQPIEIGGKRSARIAAGEAGVTAARVRDRDARIGFAYDLARAYAAAEIADRRVALAEDEVEEGQDDLGAARALVDAGKEARLRALQAESSLNAASAELETAKAACIAALARLSALAGIDEPYSGLSESLLDRPARAAIFGPVDPSASTTYLAALADRDAAERRLVVERKHAIPNVTASIGMRRLEFEKANAVVGGISIPLNIFDRNRGNIAASRAEVQAADARAAMAKNDARAESLTIQAELAAVDKRVAAADTAQATAEETYRLARIAYEAGKAPLIELLAARHGLGLARGTVLDARTARFEAQARLARLQGRTIFGDPIQ
jgi:cobalt-zinc-cadmium efflux system outer membrane protein